MHCESHSDNSQAEAIAKLLSDYSGIVSANASLRELTTFKIGGPAKLLASVTNPENAKMFLQFANDYALPAVCIGGGSNLIIDDKGFNGIVLKMEIDLFEVTGSTVTVGSGMVFDTLIAKSLDSGLTGLEFASGIPGSCGGAVIGNAGCFGHEISEFVKSVTVMNGLGEIQKIDKEDMQFSYRDSILKNSPLVLLSIELLLEEGDLEQAWQTRKDKTELRRVKHPVEAPCAGSYFKNLEPENPGDRRRAAGELLDKVGALEMSVGGASVYRKHANIIINSGNATCVDVLQLADKMQQAVKDKFGVQLIPEVRHLEWNGGKLVINS
jgi:UDP-N-acetylmuramate dehydrogenase